MKNIRNKPLWKHWTVWVPAVLLLAVIIKVGMDKFVDRATTTEAATSAQAAEPLHSSEAQKVESVATQTVTEPKKEVPQTISDVQSVKNFLKEGFGAEGAKPTWYDHIKDIQVDSNARAVVIVYTDLSADASARKMGENMVNAIFDWANQSGSNVAIAHIEIRNKNGAIIVFEEKPVK